MQWLWCVCVPVCVLYLCCVVRASVAAAATGAALCITVEKGVGIWGRGKGCVVVIS